MRGYWIGIYYDDPTANRSVEQHVDEVFVIPKTYAISDPWAMMIHSKYTLVAL